MLKGWWGERQVHEKWMIALILLLLIAVAVRWTWISRQAADAFRERFSAPTELSVPAGEPSR